MQGRVRWPFLILALLIVWAEAKGGMFCFRKRSQSTQSAQPQQQPNINTQAQPDPYVSKIKQPGQFRSYHPHYINSLSYPQPFTPHFYYGEVRGDVPVFFIRDHSIFNPDSISQLVINGVKYTDASAKYYLLHHQQRNRHMLVLQMENSYEQVMPYSMQVIQRRHHFLIICHYADTASIFRVYLTNNEQPIELTPEGLRGINLHLRNQSLANSMDNWRFSQNLRWLGRNNSILGVENYKGLVIEVEYTDWNMMKNVVINLEEEPLSIGVNLNHEISKESIASIPQQPSKPHTKQERYDSCANAAVQKVLDGVTYQYGRLSMKNGSRILPNQPRQLLSFSPSRSRFPWGFLWDDGFHCEVTVRNHVDLTVRVIKSWLDTMLEDGWIPRQQNRGKQREFLCGCPQFMVKNVIDGNPPTLILALDYLRRHNRLTQDILPKEYWLKIKKWHSWFIRTQKDSESYLFRWHDSINQVGSSYTSGMDDFPRPPSSKAHVDLQSWIYFFTKFMVEAAYIYEDDADDYISMLELIKSNFKQFIDPKDRLYKDIAFNGQHSGHLGYPSLLPLAFGLLEYGSPQYMATIRMVKQHLDTSQGLSSISQQHREYLINKDAYWKGPVWININYLFLKGLKTHYPDELYLYKKLREDLIRIVCGSWQKSGYFYENYTKGKGSFHYPFNGWTSLIALIIKEQY